MSERLSSAENPEIDQPEVVDQSNWPISTPDRVTAKGVEPNPEEYPLPATTEAVERMQLLARDLAQLKYEQFQQYEREQTYDEGRNALIEATEAELTTLNSNSEIKKSYQEFFTGQVELVKQVNQLSQLDRKINSLDADARKTSRKHSKGLVSSYVKHHLASLKEQKLNLHQEMEAILANPEIELGWRNHQLREYRRQWEQNHFVETPSRKEYIKKIQDHWANGEKTLLTGSTGSGKTELAIRAARQYSGEPEVISGQEGMTTYDIYGKPRLGPGSMTEEEHSDWEQKIRIAKDDGQRQYLLARFQQLGSVVSGFDLGKLPRAVEKGRVAIFDEFNASPQETIIIRIKHDLNLREGQEMTIQEDSNQKIKVREGYAVAATANLKSAKHKGRSAIPPEILRMFEAFDVKSFPKAELYDLCLSVLIDRRGALGMGYRDANETLFQLVSAVTDIQEAYDGTTTQFYEQGGGSTSKMAFLDKAVLDPGKLLVKLSGFRREVLSDEISFKEFLEQILTDFVNTSDYTPKERFTLLDILTQHGFLLNSPLNDFLPAQFTAEDWQRHLRGKSAVPDLPPTYLDSRSVATLDPFGVRQDSLADSAAEFLARVKPQKIGREGTLEDVSELETQLELPKQYEEMVKALTESGMVEQLNGGLGIRAIDGKEYLVPSYHEIVQELSQRPELETKIDQGFTKLLIVPFGRSLDQLIEKYKETIENHQANLQATDRTKLEVGQGGSLFKWDGYNGADLNGNLVYQPKKFDKVNHGGQTKTDILATGQGFQVLLIEDLPDLPAKGAGKTVGGRTQLEANSKPNQYLNTVQTNPAYQGEVGLTPEDWLVLATSELVNHQLVIDDWQGQGKAAYLPGAYFKGAGFVPVARWDRGNGQARLVGFGPGLPSDFRGVRVGVRVL